MKIAYRLATYRCKRCTTFALALILTSLAAYTVASGLDTMAANNSAPVPAPGDESAALVKPKTDKLLYKIITLPNKLRAILISDPETDKAAASLDVYAGSMQDPADLLGLAHFTG